MEPQWAANDVLPSEEVPYGNDRRPHSYSMEKWVKMFNPRQQLAHGHCVEAFREGVEEDRAAEMLDERRKAAWGYIGIAIDKILNYNSTSSIWHPRSEVVANTFNTHDFSFKWSYAEMPIASQGYGLEWALNDVEDCISKILEMTNQAETQGQMLNPGDPRNIPTPSEVINGEAQFIPQLDEGSIDCIVFDPPYHDNVAYAELSDFFYVWLKRTAGYVFPEDFTRHLSEKDLEAIASPARFRNSESSDKSARQQATEDYESKMAQIFAECRRVIKPHGIMTVMFTHKSTTAWDALTVALINAGFSITRTWPVKTEAESSMHIKDRAAARTTILLICRPREHNPIPEPWHRVEDLIARAVQGDIRDNLSQADLRPIDLYLSAFGPALKVISEQWGTERETANVGRPEAPYAVTPTDALQVARTEVSRHRARSISEQWANSPVDEATKFYVLANDANGGATMEFDEANLLARAIGANLDRQDPAIRSIAAFKNDKVSLLSAKDRMAAGHVGENQTPRTSLDLVHTAVALTGRRNTMDAQQWLAQKLHDPQDDRFKYTLEALIRTTKSGHDDHQAQRNLWQVLYGRRHRNQRPLRAPKESCCKQLDTNRTEKMQNQPDTFICHASEDKVAIALPLHEALTQLGVYSWLDEPEIRLGQSIRQSIDAGLARCRSATVILSRQFFAKNWTQYEMDGIVGRAMQGEILLFPIQHGITIQEIRDHSPSLAGLSLWNTAERSPEEIADEIAGQLGITKPETTGQTSGLPAAPAESPTTPRLPGPSAPSTLHWQEHQSSCQTWSPRPMPDTSFPTPRGIKAGSLYWRTTKNWNT